ncbi:MAG: hypothetical protein IPL78_32885 [Chloroflexi bacterium]|nr:hypothetical protein [Chloroflexota bacterium]
MPHVLGAEIRSAVVIWRLGSASGCDICQSGYQYRVDAVECIAVGAPRGIIKVQKEPIG